MRHFVLFLVCVCSLCFAGCGVSQDVKDAWKFTRKQYYTYLNTPAELDMEATGDPEAYQLALSEAVIGFDSELQSLSRKLSNAGHNLGPEWVMGMMREFPWLSGIALVDDKGNLISRYPDYAGQPLQVSALLEADPKERTLFDLRTCVQELPGGTQVSLGCPVFTDAVFRGLIVAYFDPQALLMQSVDPGRFMIYSPEGPVWSGNYTPSSTIVGQTDWSNLLQRESSGLLHDSSGKYFWVARYLGNVPLAYVIATDSSPMARSSVEEGVVGNLGSPNVAPDHAQEIAASGSSDITRLEE